LNNADGVTISNISVTGAYEGIFVNNGSSQLTVQNSTIFDNANAGLDITDAASSTPVIKDNVFFGDASDANRNQDYGIFTRARTPPSCATRPITTSAGPPTASIWRTWAATWWCRTISSGTTPTPA
jgi:hypothetical protein